MHEVKVTDSTLRDGHQAPGAAFSLDLRVKLATALDKCGVYRIEAGTPAMGKDEIEAIKAVKSVVGRAQVSTWNRLNLDDIEASIESKPDLIHICFPSSDRQMMAKFKGEWHRAFELLSIALAMCKSKGFEVCVGLEDNSGTHDSELIKLRDCLKVLNVKDVRLADTVGVLTPVKTKELVTLFVKSGFNVGFHAHNDLGLADTNSLIAAVSGASIIDVTLGGLGERAGNASFATFTALSQGRRDLKLNVNHIKAKEVEDKFLPLIRREDFLEDLMASDIGEFGAL
jgi:homocitrate synthase NifV